MAAKINKGTKTTKIVNIKQPECLMHINMTKNNFRLTLTDYAGNVLHTETAGMVFKGSKKVTPHAASVTSERMSRWALDRGVQSIQAKVNAQYLSSTGETSLRTLSHKGLNVLSIVNTTSIRHGGCKQRKAPRK